MPPARVTVQEVRSIIPLYESLTSLNTVFFAVKGFGVIGGGAVLFAASGLAGSAVLPLLGESASLHIQMSAVNRWLHLKY